jgi:hypothetical protein
MLRTSPSDFLITKTSSCTDPPFLADMTKYVLMSMVIKIKTHRKISSGKKLADTKDNILISDAILNHNPFEIDSPVQ